VTAPDPQGQPPGRSPATVLVVDDDRNLLEVLRRTLLGVEPGLQVATAASGEEALTLLGPDSSVAVLVADQKLPGITGLDLIARARAERPGLVSILLTATTAPEALLDAINRGNVFRYLVKPWQKDELLATVRQALAGARLQAERDALVRRQGRRLEAMTALVELSSRASAPQSQQQLLDSVRHALSRTAVFDTAALLLVPPGQAAEGSARMMLIGCPDATEQELVAARERCVAAYNDDRAGTRLDAGRIAAHVVSGPARRGRGDHHTDLAFAIGTGGDVLGALYLSRRVERPGEAYSDDDRQNLEALGALVADLSRRLVARAEAERRRMELMVASMADGVIMTDAAGEIFLLNPAARRMLGLPPPEAEGPPITAQFLKDRLGFYPFELVRAGRAEDGPVREEVRVGDQYLHSIISPVVDLGPGQGPGALVGVVVVLRDITEQKALDSRKEEFVSVVSHELRTPLTSIGGALELLVEQYDGGLSDKQLRYIQMARDSAQKLNRIVDDLLDVARAERGRLQLRTGAIDLGELLAQTADRFRGAAEQKQITMQVRSRGSIHMTADADRLTQVMSNLLSNAIKFTPEGGRIEAEAFSSSVSDEVVGFAVWNSGPAIAEADRERVFDKFEQVQQSSTRRVGGTGLGLAISRGIIERHGGQIWVEPAGLSQGGARFVVTIPVEAHEVPEGAGPGAGAPGGLGKSVLIVDDDRATTWLLKGMLLHARHRVYLAEDSETALTLARERRPDVVSVDLEMPHLSGAELVEILRHDPETRKIPILVLTQADDLGRDRAVQVGADVALGKPVKAARLRETVLTLLSEAGNLRRRVMVVDDDPAIRLISREVLEAHGFLVREAEDGKAALVEARRFKPDLILVDVMMPEIDGFELAQRLRGERETALVPIIFVSARGQTADKVRAFKLGAEDYLVKPFDSAELVARVEKALLRRDFDLGASPTTRLPGSAVIAQEIDRRLKDRGRFAFCYLDLDNLKAFNDYYGYAKADAVILQTGDIVREAVARHGTPGDFIGHIAGDDFVLITSIESADAVCTAVIEAFDRLVPLYYNKSDRERGFIEARDRFGVLRNFPVMSVSIACVTGEGSGRSASELSTLAAELKQKAKAIAGSSYVRDGEVRIPAPHAA
jgi:PAS domain S-box-containing protein